MESASAVPIEELVAEIGIEGIHSSDAIAACQMRFDECAPIFRDVLARAVAGEIDDPGQADILLAGLHVLAAGRDTLACPPLLRLLRLPGEELEWLLGDAVTESFKRIVASVFDGNADALFEMIADGGIAPMVRWALFDAAAFLAWDGRIERDGMIRFLERFDDERLGGDSPEAWLGWTDAAALLGLRSMTQRVEDAMRDGRIEPMLMNSKDWIRMLEDAERFRAEERMGYVEDAVAELAPYDTSSAWDDDPLPLEDGCGDYVRPPLFGEPVVNEWRHVGRNDPCPCGSGRKFKRCCLGKQ